MDVSTKPATSSVKAYEQAVSTGKKDKTGAQGAVSDVSSDKYAKTGGVPVPEDKLDISEAAQDKKEAEVGSDAKIGNGFADFDMDAFQSQIRSTLMASINESKKALSEAGVEFAKYNSDSILYDLSGLKDGDKTKAADVPEYWNAENTSQRIVDFAMSFRGLAPELSDEEYIKQMRGAVELGYKLAKKDLGALPGPSAKLFNDTYSLTMQKFDDILANSKKGTTAAATI